MLKAFARNSCRRKIFFGSIYQRLLPIKTIVAQTTSRSGKSFLCLPLLQGYD
jgi:hypothetical protein